MSPETILLLGVFSLADEGFCWHRFMGVTGSRMGSTRTSVLVSFRYTGGSR